MLLTAATSTSNSVWDLGYLATLTPTTFPHLSTVIVDSVGDYMPEEGYVISIYITKVMSSIPWELWLSSELTC